MDEDRLHRQPYDERQGGDGGGEADLPGRAPAPAVPGAGGRLLRVAKDRGRQEADARRHKVGGDLRLRGVWSTWKDPEGHTVPSCAIITTAANDLLTPIHARIPVVLPREIEGLWLDPGADDPGALAGVLTPYPAGAMEAYQVSTLVNSVANDGPEVIEPAGP